MEHNIYDDIISYNKIIDNRVEMIRKMNFKTLNKLIKEIDFSNRTKLVVLNKNK